VPGQPYARPSTADAVGGQYYGPAHGVVPGVIGTPRLQEPPKVDQDPKLAARLCTLSQELTGVDFPVPAVHA
jgi:hypothetical protein